jgi:hypothetical protein
MKINLEKLKLTIATSVVERALYTVVFGLYAAGYVLSLMALV